ncbi:MAG: DUF711 family protein [Desulfurococcaceae archaeon]
MANELVARAITVFTGAVDGAEALKGELELALDALARAREVLRELGVEVFSERISMPGVRGSLAERALELAGERLLSVGYASSLSDGEAAELALLGAYVPLLHEGPPDAGEALKYSRIFHAVASKDPAAATRMAVGFHGRDFLTPYFPDSSSRGVREVAISFIYPQLLYGRCGDLEAAFREAFFAFERAASAVEEATGLRVHIDYSLSPWMERSVAALAEECGWPLTRPGFVGFVWRLNEAIRGSLGPRATGFSEVMLPYAEDGKLIEHGRRAEVKARDFLSYSAACVAGVDMVVVPEGVEALAGLILDAMAIARAKGRPYAFRAIPVPGTPGDEVDLGKFGRVPIIPY